MFARLAFFLLLIAPPIALAADAPPPAGRGPARTGGRLVLPHGLRTELLPLPQRRPDRRRLRRPLEPVRRHLQQPQPRPAHNGGAVSGAYGASSVGGGLNRGG